MTTATLGQVEPFNPQVDDWVLYTERLEQFFVANGITDDAKKVAVLLTVIGGKRMPCCEIYWHPRSQPESRSRLWWRS